MRRHLSNDTEQLICREYARGYPGPEIAKMLGVPRHAVYAAIRRQGAEARRTTRRFMLDETAFDNAEENPIAQYWIGLLMADGCVYQRTATNAIVAITLSGNDGTHLEKLRHFLKSNRPLAILQPNETRPSQTTSLQVESCRLAKALATFGIIPRKSLVAEVKLLERSRDFWRGVVDGDGSVLRLNQDPDIKHGWLRPRLSLCGSQRTCEQFRDFACTIAPHRPPLVQVVNIFQVFYEGRHALPLIRCLYADCSLALPRKKAVADSILADAATDPTWLVENWRKRKRT
jgi:hypothetical protein